MRRIFLPMTILVLVQSCSSLKKKTQANDSQIKRFLIDDSTNFIPPQVLDPKQVKEDLQVLLRFLNQGYGAKDHLPSEVFATMSKDLEALATTAPLDLCDQIALVFSKVPDNHLNTKLAGKRCGKLPESTARIGANIVASPKTWDSRQTSINEKRIGIIGIRTFAFSNDPVWVGFIDKVIELKKGSDVIIVDYRGNDGGDDSKGFDLAEILMGGEAPSTVEKQVKKTTPEARVLWVNLFSWHINSLKDQGEEIPETVYQQKKEALKLLDKSLASADHHLSETKSFTRGSRWKYPNSEMFQGPIYILMDKKCGSSCESSIDAFDAMPSVKLVGENSAGTLHFGNVGKLVLPNSRIVVQMATHANIFKGGRFTEKSGFVPDVKTRVGKDALSELLKKLQLSETI